MTHYSRKCAAAERKLQQALKPFDVVFQEIVPGVYPSPRNRSLETHTRFKYKGKEYRFDYQFNCDAKLPRVDILRRLLWDSLQCLPNR